MSATMHLYTIANGVTFIPGKIHSYVPSKQSDSLDQYSIELKSIINKPSDVDSVEVAELDKKWFGHYSDNLDHKEFYFYHYRGRCSRTKQYYKTAKSLFANNIQHGRGKYDNSSFLILNEIEYAQGWFFTKKLFKSKFSTFFAFNKRDAKMLLDTTIKKYDPHDDRGAEAYSRFMKAIESLNEPFILEISW